MAATSLLLLATAITLALILIGAIALLGFTRLPAHIRASPPHHLRAALVPEFVIASSFLLGAYAAARILGEPGATASGHLAPTALLSLPVGVATICLALALLRAPHPPASTPSPSPTQTQTRKPILPLASPAGASVLTLLLILAGRLVLLDALLLLLAIPAWLWMLTEWRPAASPTAPPQATPPTDPPDSAPSRPTPPNPTPLIALLTLVLIPPLFLITLRSPFPLIGALILAGALLALLAPLALASASPRLTEHQRDWAAAPILLGATVAPLFALAVATVAHVALAMAHAAHEAEAAGSRASAGAAEALATHPYLSGLPRLAVPALLALALPLLGIAVRDVSPSTRRMAGVVLAISGIALAGAALAST